jgi:hypothetical protein
VGRRLEAPTLVFLEDVANKWPPWWIEGHLRLQSLGPAATILKLKIEKMKRWSKRSYSIKIFPDKRDIFLWFFVRVSPSFSGKWNLFIILSVDKRIKTSLNQFWVWVTCGTCALCTLSSKQYGGRRKLFEEAVFKWPKEA